jgi:hypothetical protein
MLWTWQGTSTPASAALVPPSGWVRLGPPTTPSSRHHSAHPLGSGQPPPPADAPPTNATQPPLGRSTEPLLLARRRTCSTHGGSCMGCYPKSSCAAEKEGPERYAEFEGYVEAVGDPRTCLNPPHAL